MTVAPLDETAVLEWAKRVPKVCVLEEHCTEGGLGTAVCQTLATNGVATELKLFGVKAGSKMTGPYEELLEYHGISGAKVAGALK